MAELRHIILFNGMATTEECIYCRQSFELPLGYQVLVQDGDKPAKATHCACRPCIQQREPELVEMIELFESFARFSAGQDSTASESNQPMQQ